MVQGLDLSLFSFLLSRYVVVTLYPFHPEDSHAEKYREDLALFDLRLHSLRRGAPGDLPDL